MIDDTKNLPDTKAHWLMNKLLQQIGNEPSYIDLWDTMESYFMNENGENHVYENEQGFSRVTLRDGSSIIMYFDIENDTEWWQIGYHRDWVSYYLNVHHEQIDLTYVLPMWDKFKYPMGPDIDC